MHSFYGDAVQQVSRWLERRDPDAVTVAIEHSWGLSAITSAEVNGARYDQVRSLAGAGMPSGWEPREGTAYYHWAYTDALTMFQSTGAVWDGKVPVNEPEFTSRIYEREGDFDLYFPSPAPPGGFSPAPPPSIDASENALDNHNMIASDHVDNELALDDMRRAMQTERAR